MPSRCIIFPRNGGRSDFCRSSDGKYNDVDDGSICPGDRYCNSEKYRVVDKDGHSLGGPFYYIEQGMGKNWKWLAKLFAFFGVCVGLFGIGTFSQVNGIASAIQNFFDPNKVHTMAIPGIGTYSWTVVIASLILAFCVGAVLIGGIKRIASVSQIVVPFMAVAYFVFALILIICNITKVPAAVVTVVQGAFHPRAVTGGVVGSMFVAMQKGVARGIFSNEAGLGSAPIAAAAAQTKEPVRQGLVSMTGTFIDTIVICTLTGLSIVLTGAWQVDGLEGVQVTTYAFQNGLPFPHVVSSFVLMMCLVFFAFTTILGWDYYSERCLEYLTGGNMKMLQNGTVISGTMIEKPHSFSTACNIATQIIAQVASNQYGGQSISWHILLRLSRYRGIRSDRSAGRDEAGRNRVPG